MCKLKIIMYSIMYRFNEYDSIIMYQLKIIMCREQGDMSEYNCSKKTCSLIILRWSTLVNVFHTTYSAGISLCMYNNTIVFLELICIEYFVYLENHNISVYIHPIQPVKSTVLRAEQNHQSRFFLYPNRNNKRPTMVDASRNHRLTHSLTHSLTRCPRPHCSIAASGESTGTTRSSRRPRRTWPPWPGSCHWG